MPSFDDNGALFGPLPTLINGSSTAIELTFKYVMLPSTYKSPDITALPDTAKLVRVPTVVMLG